jgi:hypothetical protein
MAFSFGKRNQPLENEYIPMISGTLRNSFYFLLFLFLGLNTIFFKAHSQDITITGRVTDAETKEPLPFVNVVYTEKGKGTTTNLNGIFSISGNEDITNLRFSYVGYEQVNLSLAGLDTSKPLLINLQRKTIEIEEVTIFPGINPAHRIIQRVVDNRDFNHPEKMRSFSYQAYNKLVFTFEKDTSLLRGGIEKNIDTLLTDTLQAAKTDSSAIRLQNFLNRQDIFLMESVSKRDYMYPGRNNEVVIASRVSGFQEPSFVLLATQLQSFSFYDELIAILDQRYLNPISRGSTTNYSFLLQDSLYTDQNDTLYIISFRPYKNKNFDGLKGVLSINSRGYAIQSLIAEPMEKGSFFHIKIQQNYRLIENRQWFPVELNTELHFPNMRANNTHYAVGKGRTYLSDIILMPELSRKNFGHVELRIDPEAHLKSEEFWNIYRTEPLSEKNIFTYRRIDSLGQANRFDRNLRLLETLASGFIPVGVVNFDYTSLIDFNQQEGFRTNLHIRTNRKVSENLILGGRIAYGFKDKRIKYGGYAEWLIYQPAGLSLGLSHHNDVQETGGYGFFQPWRIITTETNRRFVLNQLDYVEETKTYLTFQGLQYFSGELFFLRSNHSISGNYRFLINEEWKSDFSFIESGIRLRYAYREKFFQTPRGEKLSMGTSSPILFFNLIKGFESYKGEFDYLKTEARLMSSFYSRNTGTTTLVLEGGNILGEVPLTKLYYGRGSYGIFSLEAENSFGAMRMNEFLNRNFVHVFIRHNFHSLLFKTPKFKPEIILITNFGIGQFDDPAIHDPLEFKTMEKGYFESGILFNNLIRQMFLGYGLGAYYRYGAYSFPKTIDNFAFKLSFTVNL